MKKQVKNSLASQLGQRDEGPNIALAEEITTTRDKMAVEELIALLDGTTAAIQNDAIKVLYEVGDRTPALIIPYLQNFVDLLKHKNNRLQWGARTAIQCIAPEDPERVAGHLSRILKAADEGSVIMRDQAFKVLIHLATESSDKTNARESILAQLQTAPVNQLPMYAELAEPLMKKEWAGKMVEALTERMVDIEKASKVKRLEKVIVSLKRHA